MLTVISYRSLNSIGFDTNFYEHILGYYRVLYDANLTVAIAEQLRANRTKIGGLSRSQLVDDYFTFQSYGY